ncbi:MAG: DUF4258 domain-containing protein [Planctomycetota bacterium]|nr:DUF4258 domain-containing protein [Planctomycetota bacterium]
MTESHARADEAGEDFREPLSNADARVRIRKILREGGAYAFSPHAEEEMAKDGLERTDVLSVLRAGTVDGGEFRMGSWRYRVRTNTIWVVVAFRSPRELRVVTAWRDRKRRGDWRP